jgi:hypothetical protein
MGVIYRVVTELTQLDDYPGVLNDHVANLIKPGDNITIDYNEVNAELTVSASKLTYEKVFTQFDLTVLNKLPVTHNLGNYPSSLSISDQNGKPVIPDDWINESVNTVAVDLTSFVPLVGTWTLSLGA